MIGTLAEQVFGYFCGQAFDLGGLTGDFTSKHGLTIRRSYQTCNMQLAMSLVCANTANGTWQLPCQ